jgi:small-conductance mechanosensitive channel
MPQQTFLMFVLINLLGVAGIVIWHLQGRSRPTARLIVQIIFFLAMTFAVTLAGLNPFRFDAPHLDGLGSLVVAAKILWWTHLSWATIGFVRIYIVLDGRPREARLLQDLIVAIVYLGVLLSIMAFVFGVPIGTLLATSGLIAVILGLALQNTLGDVFSGIALTLGRPYAIGDWIMLGDGTEGRVVASNWRSTYLLTFAHNLVVLPNSVLARQSLTNVSKPDENHQLMLAVRVLPTRRPRFVADVMRDVLGSCNCILHEPAPAAIVGSISAAAIEVELYFQVAGPMQRGAARSEVIDLIYRHCAANGLSLAAPLGTALLGGEQVAALPETSFDILLSSNPQFSELNAEEREALAALAVKRSFAAGEIIVEQGGIATGLMVVRTGILAFMHDGEDALRLAPGDCFGALEVLTSRPEACAVKALTRASVYAIPKAAFEALMGERPELAMNLSKRLAQKSPAAAEHKDAPAAKAHGRTDLVHAIRAMFHTAQ